LDSSHKNKSLNSIQSKTIVKIIHNLTTTEFTITNKMLSFDQIYETLELDYISNLSYFNDRKNRSVYIFVINLSLKIY
jgi:hypothetical protein